jgi:hypothetical protein
MARIALARAQIAISRRSTLHDRSGMRRIALVGALSRTSQ